MRRFGPASASVAPRAGAWIETNAEKDQAAEQAVAPRAGAWIETIERNRARVAQSSRSPCGGVD